jgi:UDP-N-acetylglucosamine 4,6-dehydratase (inverting)
MDFLNQASILITGGTGTLGKALVHRFLEMQPKLKRLVVFSRDEQKQFHMAQEFPEAKYPGIRYFIGDVRDLARLRQALNGIDHVIHTAAMKHIPIAEYNPMECIKTNIIGSQNVINASIDCGVKRVVALSTDKAAAPVNLYGATKLAADKLFVASNSFAGGHDIRFSVVRYGNVMSSNGSVIPFFQKKRKDGVLPITHPEMTRFNITVDEAVDIVLFAMKHAFGGEIFVPKLPSYRILDLAKAIAPECKTKIVGIREGEKIHEEMITRADAIVTYDIGKYYVILQPKTSFNLDEFIAKHSATSVVDDFCYQSGNNDDFLTVDEIKELIRTT